MENSQPVLFCEDNLINRKDAQFTWAIYIAPCQAFHSRRMVLIEKFHSSRI
ncbi:hypothetical protein CHS0354_022665 [Potamilus streckersoni]|uniref:Uncharacterized protein n=1 Tax=Potamilus streckersoni TaxID=2493646 RepID=A0AAE0TE65_9BIVA|nr:hypothetical protein CHS0354_022665 [Potamilus streckersoni]